MGKIHSIYYNCFYGKVKEEFEYIEVGKNNVVKIMEHCSLDSWNRFYYDILYKGGMVKHVFNVNSVVMEEQTMWFISELAIKFRIPEGRIYKYAIKHNIKVDPYIGLDDRYLGHGISDKDANLLMENIEELKGKGYEKSKED